MNNWYDKRGLWCESIGHSFKKVFDKVTKKTYMECLRCPRRYELKMTKEKDDTKTKI